jgi:hypothetical protein
MNNMINNLINPTLRKLRRNVEKFGKKSLKRFFLNLSIFRLHLSKFESINNLKMVNVF